MIDSSLKNLQEAIQLAFSINDKSDGYEEAQATIDRNFSLQLLN